MIQTRLGWFYENMKWLALLSTISALTALVRFGWIYPDSESYLLLVSYFRGEIALSETAQPFSYRPLLPFIAYLMPLQTELVFAFMNTAFVVLLSWTLFALSSEFGFSKIASFLASSLCSFSWVVAYYGAAVLVDTGAVFFLSLALLMIYRDENDVVVALILTVGVLFKEIAMVGAIVSIFWLRRFKPLTLFLPLSTHLMVRFFFAEGQAGYVWHFHLDSFGIYLESTIKTLGLTLGPFVIVLFVAIVFRAANAGLFRGSIRWLIYTGLPCSLILFMGLFMAYFSSRFVWPLYPALVPIMAFGFSQIVDRARAYYANNISRSSQGERATS